MDNLGKNRVFISHASKDKAEALRLEAALRAQGLDPWLDALELLPGGHLSHRINEALVQSTAGVILLPKASLASVWVQAEMGYLIYASIQEGKPLIPVLMGIES